MVKIEGPTLLRDQEVIHFPSLGHKQKASRGQKGSGEGGQTIVSLAIFLSYAFAMKFVLTEGYMHTRVGVLRQTGQGVKRR